jgi:hypothetical protein
MPWTRNGALGSSATTLTPAFHAFGRTSSQASLGASAYLLPGVIPANQRDDVHAMTLTVLEIAQAALPNARLGAALLNVGRLSRKPPET